MIGKLLGHTNVHMTARYAHLANDPLKSAANRIASRIADVAGYSTPRTGWPPRRREASRNEPWNPDDAGRRAGAGQTISPYVDRRAYWTPIFVLAH